MNVVNDVGDHSILRSVTDLPMNFGLSVVAEGVEGPDAFDMLSTYGCIYAQGFHTSRPLSAARLAGWLDSSPWQAMEAIGNSASGLLRDT